MRYAWRADGAEYDLQLVSVAGTGGRPFLFGAQPNRRPIEVKTFHIATTPVTQALWMHVMGANPSERPDLGCPFENGSWDAIHAPGGFLERINAGPILKAFPGVSAGARFRLPSEAEWEYAARGGPAWSDGFLYSGSNDVDAVAWYGRRWMYFRRDFWSRFFPTRTHPVATKAPNQLGLYDMSGNVWEWCEDACVDLDRVPADSTPASGPGPDRRLRGGCHHNGPMHCTVSFRYGIQPDAHDGCIGFRLVLAGA